MEMSLTVKERLEIAGLPTDELRRLIAASNAERTFFRSQELTQILEKRINSGLEKVIQPCIEKLRWDIDQAFEQYEHEVQTLKMDASRREIGLRKESEAKIIELKNQCFDNIEENDNEIMKNLEVNVSLSDLDAHIATLEEELRVKIQLIQHNLSEDIKKQKDMFATTVRRLGVAVLSEASKEAWFKDRQIEVNSRLINYIRTRAANFGLNNELSFDE
jgi:hypothetical protein